MLANSFQFVCVCLSVCTLMRVGRCLCAVCLTVLVNDPWRSPGPDSAPHEKKASCNSYRDLLIHSDVTFLVFFVNTKGFDT